VPPKSQAGTGGRRGISYQIFLIDMGQKGHTGRGVIEKSFDDMPIKGGGGEKRGRRFGPDHASGGKKQRK